MVSMYKVFLSCVVYENLSTLNIWEYQINIESKFRNSCSNFLKVRLVTRKIVLEKCFLENELFFWIIIWFFVGVSGKMTEKNESIA